ncbi:hypothetical protein ACLKA6_019544 [Drosophila palustris]
MIAIQTVLPSQRLCEEFARALTKSEWEDKDEFLDVIYWSRQVFGILLGIIWGIVPLKVSGPRAICRHQLWRCLLVCHQLSECR